MNRRDRSSALIGAAVIMVIISAAGTYWIPLLLSLNALLMAVRNWRRQT